MSSAGRLLTRSSNRRLDNKLNIFEGIQRNYFFVVMNIIMVAGQVLIIFVAGPAFKVERQNGKEWGMAIGLGAISIPWGALLRLIPDAWIAKCLPWFIRKRWSPESITAADKKEHEEEQFAAPLRTLSMIRGKRPTQHIGFRDRVHDAKVRAKEKMNNSSIALHEKMNGNGNGKNAASPATGSRKNTAPTATPERNHAAAE